MANQPINLGTAPLGEDGDTVRQAFTKVNENTAELYSTKADTADLAAVATSGEAADVTITDAGNYYTSTDAEGALQEVGAMIGDIATALDLINGEVI